MSALHGRVLITPSVPLQGKSMAGVLKSFCLAQNLTCIETAAQVSTIRWCSGNTDEQPPKKWNKSGLIRGSVSGEGFIYLQWTMAGKDFKCGLSNRDGLLSLWSFISGNSKCATPKATTSVQDHLDVECYSSTAEERLPRNEVWGYP